MTVENPNPAENQEPEISIGGIAPQESNKPEATAAPRTPEPEAPKFDEAKWKEYQRLQKAEEDRRKAELTETERYKEELETLRKESQQAKLTALIAESQVPAKLKNLIPQDYDRAKEFLGSQDYKELVQAIQATAAPKPPATTPKPEPETKDSKKSSDRQGGGFSKDALAKLGQALQGGV